MRKLKQKISEKLGEKKTASLKKALRVARIVKNVICWIMIAVLALALVIFVVTKLSGETPTVFGYSLHRIVSGSMTPELQVGDVIINKDVAEPTEIDTGDIVTFQGGAKFENQKVTHRVVTSPYSNENGVVIVVTKGDANEYDDGEIAFSAIESKYLGKVTVLKDIYNFFFSQWGLVVFIFLLLLIFFDEIMNIVKLTFNRAQEEEPESLQELYARFKREQQLAENAESDSSDPSTEERELAPSDQTDQKPTRSQKKKAAAQKPKKNGGKKKTAAGDKTKQKKKNQKSKADKAKKKNAGAKPSGKKKPKKKAKKRKRR